MKGKLKNIAALWGSMIVVLLVMVLVWSYLGRYIRDLFFEHISSIENLVSPTAANEDSVINIEQVLYQKKGVEASYPKLLSGASPASLELWNEVIKKDFDKMLKIYSFEPFPGPTPSSTDVVPIVLMISYQIKGNTDAWLSLIYRANYSSTYSAHPSNLVYTTNIDKRTDRRVGLSDLVILNEAFVKEFRTWKRSEASEVTEEVEKAINEYISHISDEELLAGFRASDQIGSNNPWGIYTYLTKDNLGISIEVPNYAGDHAEFEQSLAVLKSKGLLRNDSNNE